MSIEMVCVVIRIGNERAESEVCRAYDREEKVLFWLAQTMGLTIDQAYSLPFVRFFMRLSASSGGTSVKRPR